MWYLLHTLPSTVSCGTSWAAPITTLLPHGINESPEIRVTQDEGREQRRLAVQRVGAAADGARRGRQRARPQPHMARLKNLTYAAAVLVDVVHDITTTESG